LEEIKNKDILKLKSYKFALRIIKLYKYLCENNNEKVLSKQILRSGTSIGANVEESIGGQSIKDFRSKILIAYREARETKYWLNLLRDSEILESKLANSLIKDCEELIKISGKIVSTTKTIIENS